MALAVVALYLIGVGGLGAKGDACNLLAGGQGGQANEEGGWVGAGDEGGRDGAVLSHVLPAASLSTEIPSGQLQQFQHDATSTWRSRSPHQPHVTLPATVSTADPPTCILPQTCQTLLPARFPSRF